MLPRLLEAAQGGVLQPFQPLLEQHPQWLLEQLRAVAACPVQAELLKRLPQGASTPELQIDMAEGEAQALIERLKQGAHFKDAELITLDGLRVEYEDGFGLLRASNTTPSLVPRFEGDDSKALKRIQAEFRKLLSKAIASPLPF